MASREIRLEQLLGKTVRTAAGRPVGRIEDLRVEPQGEEYIVREVVLGESGLISKLLQLAQQLPTFSALGFGRRYRTRAVPWDWLDFSDVERPRFRSPSHSEED
jgi:sporulation protein YlmC with PRC-barrel domain